MRVRRLPAPLPVRATEGSAHVVVDRLERIIVRLESRAGGQTDNQVLLRFENYVITGFAERWFHAEIPSLPVHRDVHENVEGYWNAIRGDPVRRKSFGEIPETAPMRSLVAVDYSKGICRAGCQEEVVTTNRVLNNTKKNVASVGVEWIARC